MVLHTTPLVVLDEGISDSTLRRRYELAGCALLPAPTYPHELTQWDDLLAAHAHRQNVPFTSLEEQLLRETRERDALLFRQAASAAYAALTGRQSGVSWTADEVRGLLGALRLPSPRRSLDKQLIDRLGGYVKAKSLVRRCAALLPEKSYTPIVLGMLDGKKQEIIAADLYRTREWVCRHLPVLCAMLAEIINQQTAFSPPSQSHLAVSTAA
jgi:hypothetical protein